MKNISYKTILKYFGVLVVFYIAEKIVDGAPMALAYYSAFSLSVCSPIVSAVLYIALSFLTKPPQTAILLTFSVVFLCIVFSIYKLKKRRPKFELALFFAVALLPYILDENATDLTEKLVYSAIIATLAFVLQPAFTLCFVKKLKCKGAAFELTACFITVVYTSLGAINAFGYKLWYDIALIAVLYFCYYFKSTRAFIPAFVLPIALAIHSQSLEIISVFMLYCSSVLIFAKTSRLLSALALFITAFAYNYFGGNIFVFNVFDYIFAFAPMVVFLFTPNAFYRLFKDRFLRFDEPEITRELINAERGELSARLYGISDVFLNLEKTLDKVNGDDIVTSCEKISDEVTSTVCKSCEKYNYCRSSRRNYFSDIQKITTVGLSKGKAALADVPKALSSHCMKLNDVLYEINRLITLLTERIVENERVTAVKSLITMQAGGLSEVLKNMAYSFSDKIVFGRKNEKILFDSLATEGIVPLQLIRAGQNYHLLLAKEKNDYATITAVISDCEQKKYRLSSKTDVGSGLLAVFSPAPVFDACFGFAKRTKLDSPASGDNYTLKKIDEGKFLVALCDGMGSGETANENSQAVISLVENFFAAGLDRDVILNITSNLISACFDDGFSTLDSAVVDLYSGKCDIVKIGATFGFIIGKDGVRIIENNSLPLGVMEKVEPTVKSFSLCDGDSLIIISDGVSDAFFSSTDAVDFLSRENSANPQTFADKILEFALALNDNIAKDDMTVLVVKFYSSAFKAAG